MSATVIPSAPDTLARAREVALALPVEDRKELALTILDSLTLPFDEPDETRRAWKDEIERRIQEMRTGVVKGYSKEEFFGLLAERRSERRGQ